MNKYTYKKRRTFIKHLGSVCGYFRKKRMKLTLRDMEKRTGIPVTSLNSFELGHSSSLGMFYIYLVSCETEVQVREFLQYVVEVCLINWRG